MINGKLVNDGKFRNFPKDKEIIVARLLQIPLENFKEYNAGTTDKISFSAPAANDLHSEITVTSNAVTIQMLDATACCGTGVENFAENIVGMWQMPPEEYQSITSVAPENVKMLRVFGDSMEPTLSAGDWVLVDTSQNFINCDGMFLIRMASGLAVKRIQAQIGTEIIIKSDNPKYDNITANVGDVSVLGKIIYTLKAEKVG